MACLTNFCATNFPPSTSVPRTYWHSSKFYWRWFGICSNIFSLYELYSRFMTKRHLNSLTRIISYCDCNYKVILWPFSILSERFLRVFFWLGSALACNIICFIKRRCFHIEKLRYEKNNNVTRKYSRLLACCVVWQQWVFFVAAFCRVDVNYIVPKDCFFIILCVLRS